MAEQVGILGTGRMGSALARLLVGAGCEVMIGSRSPERARAAAEEASGASASSKVIAGDYVMAARDSKIVILALPYRDVDPLLRELESELEGKIVVDITNPFGAAPPGLSGAEIHAPLLPGTASLVAAFKTNYFRYFDPAVRGGIVHDAFYCGEEEAAKKRVADLIAATGFRPVDCGTLESARTLDAMVPLLMEIARRNNSESLFAWKFLP